MSETTATPRIDPLHCPHCGAKNDDCAPYQAGDVCINGHEITAQDLQQPQTKAPAPTLGSRCPNCSEPNADCQTFVKGDECPRCHRVM